MNIWCDVCSKNKASVFCSADEAALCDDCDSRVHQANKLASKHRRFSLLQPSSSQSPLCDICQEKKALLFCQQDRAILCIDCDLSIHTANELTKNHSRFLLTGVKLTTAKPIMVDSVPDKAQPTTTAITDLNTQLISNGGSTSSTISEYLIDILPGWQVEDLLDSSSDQMNFSKESEKDMLFLDSNLNSYENMGLWVPQAPAGSEQQFNLGIYGLEMGKGGMGRKVSRKRIDEGYTVPEISQQFLGSNKRLRDEAALCSACDQRVHQANKIALRHKRFSLRDSSSDHMPLCDICQKRRGLLFCHQDRVILCGDCDRLRHEANEHTQKHNRFLLMGINLSTCAKHHESLHSMNLKLHDMNSGKKNSTMDYYGGSSSASTISEYLTCILPGWDVEDLLDSISSPPRLSEDKQPALEGEIDVDLRRKMNNKNRMDEKSRQFQRKRCRLL